MKHPAPLPSLHIRSHFSLLAGTLSPDDICAQAAAAGAESVGMVDRANLYGLPAFYRSAERRGVKPIVGVEFQAPGAGAEEPPLFTWYPLSAGGFARLNRLLTARAADPERDPVELLLEEGWEDSRLVLFSPGLISRLLERSHRGLLAGLVRGLPFRGMLAAARRHRIAPVAVNPALYRSDEEGRLYRLLRAVDENRALTGSDPRPPEFRRLVSAADMEACFSAVPDALYQVRRLADEAPARLFPASYVFPSFEGRSPGEEFALLRSLCEAGIRRRYGAATEAIRRRLSGELEIIRKKGFAGYFLVVHQIVARCPRTCGRGSSAASIVSYLLGITHVDPLAYDLFFERFLNMGRHDPPDIDVDFPWDEREETLRFVFEQYAGRAGMVADHVTFGPRSALREAARACGIPEPDIAPLAEAHRLGEGGLPPYLAEAAGKLRGMPRHLGTHPGGVVITPGPITDYTHLTVSPLCWPLIAWEKDGAEEAGLVKIDLLGNRSLGVLRDVIELTAARRSEDGEAPFDWESFNPLGDVQTRRMIEAGDTLGVFYVESPATRQLLKKMRTGDYPHLVIASSIIRPAANRYITAFLERLHGASYRPVHPAAEEVLRESYGIMVYQEDVARVAMAVCGFSAAEADGLRKLLSKKERGFSLPALRETFISKGEERGVSRTVLTELWDGILSFEGYSFCKAHSASYALVSYRLAWMKSRYPLEFFCAVVNNGGGFYSRQVYLDAVRLAGFPLLPPDVNRSLHRYSVERREYPEGALRTGLGQLKGIDESLVVGILDERRRRGAYADFEDLLTRLKPSLPDMRVLIRSGALDGIAGGTHRPGRFWRYFHASEHPELFALPPAPPSLRDYSRAVKLRDEVETTGLLLSHHPAELLTVPDRRRGLPVLDSRSISAAAGERVAVAGVLVTGKEVRTRRKREMCFLSFSDRYGIFETVLFPEVYRRHYAAICRGYGFLVVGRVELEFGVAQLIVEELVALESTPLDSPPQVCHYGGRSSFGHEDRYTLHTAAGGGG